MINKLLDSIEQSKSVYHVTSVMEERLLKEGFEKIVLNKDFKIVEKKKYYIKKYGGLIAFTVGSLEGGFKIICSHTDSPSIKIKSNPDIQKNGYHLLNTEVYGGPILNTWFDKPLSIAGIVRYISNGKISEKLVDFIEPICIIPNLAIHMNREVNNGTKIDKQFHLKPIISSCKESEEADFLELLSKNVGIKPDDILSFDLNLYNTQPPQLIGLDKEYILAPRLDNLSMSFASLEALIEGNINSGIALVACFDAEEIGSLTYVGGDSAFLSNILERIGLALGMSRGEYLRFLEDSFAISADLAHSIHPNYPEKADETNRPVINKGFVVKKSSNRKYATDPYTESKLVQIAKNLGIDYQIFFNNSNESGGTTIGPIMSSKLPIATVDLGNPILGMHSEREMGGVKDYENIIKLFIAFYGDQMYE